uniref:Uncharacterized protein n=1 Tax=Neogobius melanostomus TaxID=47308 RepID=A0A8C6WWG2_9GOBI
MAGSRIMIANALEDLTPEDLTKFTARLKEPRGDEHKPARFKQAQLIGKDHQGLADLLADSFSGHAVSITVALLRAIGANRVADELGECIYPVTSNSIKNRVALLITNITFTKLNNRPGAEKDEENMEKLLSTLGYEVVKHTNLTAKKMENALDDFSKHPKLKETDSVFVPDELKVDHIYDNLNAKNCPALVDKPKIIIIQACRGEETGSVLVQADDVAVREIDENVFRYTHKEKDFIALLSSTPHTKSWRNTFKGSYLIWFTVDVFQTNVVKDHIEDLFRKVCCVYRLKLLFFPSILNLQMATKDRCTLTHHFFLFPGDLKQ